MRSHTIDVRGVPLRWEAQGAGDPVILVHGITTSPALWRHVVPLLCDRDINRTGVEVSFFGEKTTLPSGPAALALRTGAPLYTASMWYEPDVPCGRLEGPIEVPGREAGPLVQRARLLTQRVADVALGRLLAALGERAVGDPLVDAMAFLGRVDDPLVEDRGGAGGRRRPGGLERPLDRPRHC